MCIVFSDFLFYITITEYFVARFRVVEDDGHLSRKHKRWSVASRYIKDEYTRASTVIESYIIRQFTLFL